MVALFIILGVIGAALGACAGYSEDEYVSSAVIYGVVGLIIGLSIAGIIDTVA